MDNNGQIHVTEWGRGGRVVLVHGGTPGGGADAFRAQKELEERWHLVLPDRPGHGRSPKQGREDFERDAVLLAPLLAERSHLVGHSYGGLVVLYMAASRADAVRSLTLIEPPAYCFGAGDPIVERMARENRQLFENPPPDPVEMMRALVALLGIDIQVPDPAPESFVPIAQAFAQAAADIRGPEEAQIDPRDLIAGGYPIRVLTSGRTAGFERVADAIADQTGGQHIVVPGTDHAVQNAGEAVNPLLEHLWDRS